jgi:hypothetical protein
MASPPPFSVTTSIKSLALSIFAACLDFSAIFTLFSPPALPPAPFLPFILRIAREFMDVITPFRSTTIPRKILAVEMAIVVGSTFLSDSSEMLTWRFSRRSVGGTIGLYPPLFPPHE